MPREPFRTGLNGNAFRWMSSEQKKMEFRLRRDKWENLRAGDIIEFTNDDDRSQVLRVKVAWVVNFPTFAELLDYFDPRDYTGKTKLDQLEGLMKEYGDPSKGYYSRAEEREHTVLGIKVEILELIRNAA